MSLLLNSKLHEGSGRDPEPMGIKRGIAQDLKMNKIYLDAKPFDFRNKLLKDPTNIKSSKPLFEPSINRDKMDNPHKLPPHADYHSQFNYIPPYFSPYEFTPKCVINF